MKWYWIVAIIILALIIGYVIGKNTGGKSMTAVTTTTPATVTTVTPTSTGTGG